MHIPQDKHEAFYNQQIKAYEDEWLAYAQCSMKILIQERRLFVGRIWGVQEQQGNVILQFNEGEVPRMKQPYFLGLVGPDASGDPMLWDFSYYEFRNAKPPFSRYYAGIHAEIYTLAYWKTEESKSYILVSGFDASVLSVIKEKHLDHQKHPLVVVAETDPPVEYLKKLKAFVAGNKGNEILNLNLAVTEENWRPTNLDNKANLEEEVLDLLDKEDVSIIQGPPGTGKTYLVAEICEHAIRRQHSVCVTTLTNKALMEIATKEGLQRALTEGKVYKTNLSSDEGKTVPKLRQVESFTPTQGEVLLTTYYKLAQKYSEIIAGKPRFDLMIIEEASQAYLATIAMFCSIAKKVLIVGDHKQLTPVVVKPQAAKAIFSHIDGVIQGLKTFAFNNNSLSYRLTMTRRLTSDAARLTSLYYDNSLKSISKLEGNSRFSTKYSSLFHPNGGVTLAQLPTSMSGFSEKQLLSFMVTVALNVRDQNPDMEVALLTPYVDTEGKLYTEISKRTMQYKNLTINTIHKIQGLTTDVTLLYLPLQLPHFDLNDNLFNVGTSRAKRGTLIITYEHIRLVSAATPATMQFIARSSEINQEFMRIFRQYLTS